MDLGTAGSAAEPGTRACGREARGRGGAGRPSPWLWAWWVGRPRPRPEGPLATRGQWESRVPLARGEARLARCLPVSHVLPRGRRRLAPPGASRGREAAHAGAPLRSPRLGVGNARRPLQAWCRWSALGSPVRPPPRSALVRPAKPAGAPTSSAAALRPARVTRTASPGASSQGAAPPCARAGVGGTRDADCGASRAGACGRRLRPRQREPHCGFRESSSEEM